MSAEKPGTAPARPARCSPLAAWYQSVGRGTRLVEDMELPAALATPRAQNAALRLRDLSWRRRVGCKGPAAGGWLAAAGLQVPEAPNSANVDAAGIFVARLAASEFLIEAMGGDATRVEAVRGKLEAGKHPPGVYPVARQDLVVDVSGPATDALLRQTCNVDFEPLLRRDAASGGPVILTSMVGVGVVAWPRRGVGGPAVTLWTDPSFAYYFWTTLLAVGRDLEGGVAVAEPLASGHTGT